MILDWRMCIAGIGAVVFTSVPARADVLQIDQAGAARWVAGALAQAGPLLPNPALEGTLGDEVVHDERAVADPAWHARVVPTPFAAKVQELSRRFDLSPALIEALVWQESRWRADAVSPKGARGLGQLMPGTAREMGVDPDDPHANLEGAARYLRAQIDRFDGDLERALAAYNAGPGRVARAGGVPRIAETQRYVAAVMGRLSDHSRE